MTDTDSTTVATAHEAATAHEPEAVGLTAACHGLPADVAQELKRVSDGFGEPLCRHHPQSQTVTGLTRTLVMAGFRLHDCAARERTGGVCLTPSSTENGIIVTWTTHDSLALDANRYDQNQDVHEVMNYALADVLRASGWRVTAFGQASAHIVTGRIDERAPGRQS